MPRGPVEGFLVDDIARSTVQIETCSDLMIVDAERAHLRISNCWADDRRAQAVRLASQLSNDPFRVGNMLEQTRHGTEVKLGCWDNLYSVTETSKAWDEPQRQMAFDLLSVPQVLRNGSGVVPAGDNVLALRALVARERKRLQTRLDVVLIDRDKAQKEAAELGLPIEPDTATRRLRSAEARAQRRLKWAIDTLEKVRKGVDPSSLIDPETRKPLAPVAEAAAAEPAPAPAPEPPAPPPPPPPARPPLPPLPEGCEAESQEMMLVAAEAIRGLLAAPATALPTTVLPISIGKPPKS